MPCVGGAPWHQWFEKLKPAVTGAQCRDGNQQGSWDPVDPWGHDGGRVYATALMDLCLQVGHRHARVLGNPDRPTCRLR